MTLSLAAKDVFKIYANYLESESWCIDSSGTSVMAFHASSGHPANLEHFANIFSKWSKQADIRVQADEYDSFISSLRTKLPRRLHSILGSTMRPTPSPFVIVNGATFANTYAAFKPTRPANYAAPLAEELLDRLLPDKSERKWCLQFLAHAIQKPLERPQHGLLITGKPGTCKSSLMRLVRVALGGRHFYSKNDYTQALQKFSEVLPDNLVVVFDDAIASKDTYESLKDTVTREWQPVELKGTQKLVNREVFARIVVISNSVRPLRLVDDRRFFAPAHCEHQTSKEDSAEFGKNLDAWIKTPGTAETLYHWFMDVDLTGFTVGSCPRTETLIQMEGASTPALERHIHAFIEDRTGKDSLEPIFHEKDISAYLANAGLQRVSLDEIAHKLIAQGYELKKRRNPYEAGKFIFMWQPAGKKRTRNLSETDKKALSALLNPTF